MRYTAAHWGTYEVQNKAGTPTKLLPFEEDLNPSAMGDSMLETLSGPCRISSPVVRQGYLEHGPDSDRSLRGKDPFVEVSWDQALDLVAGKLEHVRSQFGNSAIYAGSYGWASAGRFHHAQSQLRRFMNLFGGCTTARDSYSYAAAEVILPHVVGSMSKLLLEHTSWKSIADEGALVVAFGGMALRNSQANSGGTGCHSQLADMRTAREAGVEFVNISPSRADTSDDLGALWLPIRPNTDTALMLGLAHTLVAEGLHDEEFLARYCVGFEKFLPYVMGTSDGEPKNAEWAANITDIPSEAIRTLARRMAATPTLINASWSLTRQQNGEQCYWMLITLAAMLGGIGKPGRGFGLGLGAVNGVGNHRAHLPWAALPTGKNPLDTFIPVSRIADMLLNPNQEIAYNGQTLNYPEIQMIYWVGGNPFHHHQDLNRLRRAWQTVNTVIVHEPFWTPTARYADIVLPATVGLERNDLAASPRDNHLIASRQVAPPNESARDDFDIFAGLAERLKTALPDDPDFKSAFTDDKTAEQWVRDLYQISKDRGDAKGYSLPEFDDFWEVGSVRLDPPTQAQVSLKDFRLDPEGNPLSTPSGRIEIFSQSISEFKLPDNPGHPVWHEPDEWLGADATNLYPLHLVTHQPERRLHSQLDHGVHSRNGKVENREPCRINPNDAAFRDIAEGDLVRLFNSRGSCISAARLDSGVRPGVIMMATGAWYDPDWEKDENCCKHGNPNTLTADLPTSNLAQGPSALTCLIEIERLQGEAPAVTAFIAPQILPIGGS